MKRLTIRALGALALIASLASGAGAAQQVPYQRLANQVGTPNLADSSGTKDKSQLLLHFTPNGQTYAKWTKLTTISILKVDPSTTQAALRGVIERFRSSLAARKARVLTFDVAPAYANAYFQIEGDGELDRGIAYSPRAGYVTIAQVAQKIGQRADPQDGTFLKKLIGR